MKFFLAKTDPETYSIDDLKKDNETVWDGIHNYTAINVIKKMKKGDIMLIYHSMGKAALVGAAKITSDGYENKNDPRFSWAVDVKFLKKFPEEKYITLKSIKDSKEFNDWALVKQSRLSTMEVPEKFLRWSGVEELI